MEKDSVIFQNAIDTMNYLGWTNRPNTEPGVCIWQSVVRQIPTEHGWDAFDVELARLKKIVMNHFGVTQLGEVFGLNDNQPTADGKRWAIMHLSSLRDKARQNEIENAAAKPFFGRLWDAISGKW